MRSQQAVCSQQHKLVSGQMAPLAGRRVDRTKYQIQIPLPPKIDPTVTMMTVEEKPDVTYADIGAHVCFAPPRWLLPVGSWTSAKSGLAGPPQMQQTSQPLKTALSCAAGGCKEQIERMREVVELPMLHPERFVALGIDPPKGVLCYGPPGARPRE